MILADVLADYEKQLEAVGEDQRPFPLFIVV